MSTTLWGVRPEIVTVIVADLGAPTTSSTNTYRVTILPCSHGSPLSPLLMMPDFYSGLIVTHRPRRDSSHLSAYPESSNYASHGHGSWFLIRLWLPTFTLSILKLFTQRFSVRKPMYISFIYLFWSSWKILDYELNLSLTIFITQEHTDVCEYGFCKRLHTPDMNWWTQDTAQSNRWCYRKDFTHKTCCLRGNQSPWVRRSSHGCGSGGSLYLCSVSSPQPCSEFRLGLCPGGAGAPVASYVDRDRTGSPWRLQRQIRESSTSLLLH